jgi:hypothetical protein
MLLPLVVDPGISQKIKARDQARRHERCGDCGVFVWRGSFCTPLPTDFIYPCSHLSNAGTEQLTMAGDMGLTTFRVSIATHSTGDSSHFVYLGRKFALSRLVLPTWWHRDPLRLRTTCMISDYLPPDLHSYSFEIFRSSSKSRTGFLQPCRRACTASPFARRVTVDPLPACYTAPESAI